jgi:hypothetical protein
LLSLEERIDTNSAAGELVFHLFGVIVHIERRLIAEWTNDGIGAARLAARILDGNLLIRKRLQPRSIWLRQVCRQPWPPGSSAWGALPFIAKSAAPAQCGSMRG